MDEEDLTYKMDIIIDKCNINKSAFYELLRIGNVQDRKLKFKILNYCINATPSQLKELADAAVKVKGK